MTGKSLLLALLLAATTPLAALQPIDCGRRPASLRGSDVDGSLALDAQGRFVPTPGARLLFDHFLTATGEEPLEAIRARVAAEAGARLPEAAAADAVRLFDLYLAYLDQARAAAPVKGRLDEEAALALLSDLRREVLGREVAEIFFGAEEAADRAALRTRITREPVHLSPEEQALRDEAALRARGAAPAELRAFRERTFGAAAADRLEAMDREEADFRARLSAYRAKKASGAPAGELLAAFTPEERLRVEALDRIEGK